MAIRYRLPSSGAAAVSPATQSYSHTQATRRPLPTSDSSALATQAYTPDAGDHLVAGDAHHIQFVSDALAANLRFASGQAFKYAIQCLEAHTNNNLTLQVWAGIYSSDGSTLLATIRSKVADNTELATALTNRFFSGTLDGSYTTTGGERLVVEFSVVGTPAASSGTQGHNSSLRWGSAGAGGDLPENDSSTGTTLNPWIEFDPIAIAPLAGTDRSTLERGVTTGMNLVVGAAPGRATIARAAAAILLTTVALSGTGRSTPARDTAQLTSRVALASTGRATPARGIGDLTIQSGGTPVALSAIGRVTPSRGVTQGISLVVGASPGRATPARGAGTITQKTALTSIGRSTPARGLGDLSASGVADLAGSGRATPARGLGGLTTRVALAATGRTTPAGDRAQLQMQGTTVSLAATGRSTHARGVTTGITLVAGAAPDRATPARGVAQLSVTGGGPIVSLAGTGRDTPARGTIPGPLVIRIAIGAERSTPARGTAQLTTDVALASIGRPTPARGSAVLSFAGGDIVPLAATGRATPVRGIATLRTTVALAGTGRATTARAIATLRTVTALVGTGRATAARGVSQLTLQPFTQPLFAIGRMTPVRGLSFGRRAEHGPTTTWLTPADPYAILTVDGVETFLSLDDVRTILTPDEP